MESPIWGTISEWGWGDLVDAITGKCCLTNSLEGKVGSSLGLSPSSRPSAPELKVIMKEWAARGGGVQPWTGSHRLGKRHRHCRFIPTQRETSQVMPDKICTLWTNQICAAPKSSVGKGNGELAGNSSDSLRKGSLFPPYLTRGSFLVPQEQHDLPDPTPPFFLYCFLIFHVFILNHISN